MHSDTMNTTTCAISSGELLGRLPDASYLARCPNILYTRTQLLATGWHLDVSTLAEQAGFHIRVFFQQTAFVRVLEGRTHHRDRRSDLYAALLLMREAIMKAPLQGCPVLFQMDDLTLIAHFGQIDHDDPRPAITIALAPSRQE